MLVRIRHPEKLIYPESDGRPMGENTLQFQWIMTLFHGFESYYFNRDDVFVAGDLFWYPVQGDPTNAMAPDLMIVFGRPKGYRSSYKQWEEENVAPQVVIEIQSPSNTVKNLAEKRAFYKEVGVEEFYQYAPETGEFEVRVRSERGFRKVLRPDGYSSPRLGMQFHLTAEKELRVIRPDGRPFASYREIMTAAGAAQTASFEERSRRLAAKLRELGVDPDRI
jgi:Uma2 family endonuclease